MTEDNREWIGVDMDGTLATYDGWTRWDVFGEPVAPMVDRVKQWLADGQRVKIFTARVAGTVEKCLVTGERVTVDMMTAAVHQWLIAAGLPALEVTCKKDHLMTELWDDRCVQVVANTGRTLTEEHEAELQALRGRAWRPEPTLPETIRLGVRWEDQTPDQLRVELDHWVGIAADSSRGPTTRRAARANAAGVQAWIEKKSR